MDSSVELEGSVGMLLDFICVRIKRYKNEYVECWYLSHTGPSIGLLSEL